MPRRYKKKKPRRRRPRIARNIPIGGLAKKQMVRLRYVEEISLNPAAAATAYNAFSCNGMYDPNVTGTGHQPSNFDLYFGTNQLYDHYTVLSSKIRVTPVYSSSAAVSPSGYWGVVTTDTATRMGTISANGPTYIMEQRLGKFSRTTTGIPAGYGVKHSIVQPFSTARFFGKPKNSVLGDSTYKGDSSNNPADQAYFTVWYASVAANDPAAMYFLIEIEYIALLSEPRPAIDS